MSIFLILLSFCTYPVVLGTWPEQQAAYKGTFATDLFTYFRAILIVGAGILLIPKIKNLHIGWFCLLFLLTLSTVFSRHPETALFGTPNHYEGFLVICAYFIFAMQGAVSEKALRYPVYIVGFFALLQLVTGCYFLFPGINDLIPQEYVFEIQRYPVFSTLGNPNHVGLFCALLFPFFVEKRDLKASAILLALLILSGNRGAWVAVLVTTFYLFRKNWKAIAVVAAICMTALIPRVKETFDSLHWPIQPGDLNARALIWEKTIPMLKDKWVLGAGPGAYALDFPNGTAEMEKHSLHKVVVDRPHNIYLHTWYAMGFVSLLVWAWLVRDFFCVSKDRALKAGILGFLVAGLFTDSVVSVTPYFMAMLGDRA